MISYSFFSTTPYKVLSSSSTQKVTILYQFNKFYTNFVFQITYNHIIKPVPISLELRKRITAAKLKGDTEAGKSVHTGTITRLWALYRATGSYSPHPNLSGRKPALSSEQPEMEIDNPVFIDEGSINTGMPRLYGRGASNERVADHTPDTRFERTTVL
jgi:hypothetical protein